MAKARRGARGTRWTSARRARWSARDVVGSWSIAFRSHLSATRRPRPWTRRGQVGAGHLPWRSAAAGSLVGGGVSAWDMLRGRGGVRTGGWAIMSTRAKRVGAEMLMHAAVTVQLRHRTSGRSGRRLLVGHAEVTLIEELNPAGPRHARRPLKADGRSRKGRRSSDHTPRERCLL